MYRLKEQAKRDAHRRMYAINFARETSFSDVLTFIRGLGGMTPGSPLKGLPTIVFEVEADESGIHHRIGVPAFMADYVISQLRGRLHGARVTPIPKSQDYDELGVGREWKAGAEISLSSRDVPLRIDQPEQTVATILSALHPLRGSQRLMLQWVVTPAPRGMRPLPQHLQKKHADQTFSAVGRIGAYAEEELEARRLLHRAWLAISTMKDHGVYPKRRYLNGRGMERLVQRRTLFHLPATLNAVELASLIAFPAGTPNVPGLPSGRTRHLAADPAIPKRGIVLGQSNYPGAERPVAVSAIDLTRHLHVVGATGTGKSTALENLILQAIKLGHGVTFIDPHGDSFDNLANRIPPERFDDVILLDLTDAKRPIGFNVLAGDPYAAMSQVMGVWDKLFGIYKLPQTADILRSTVLSLAMAGLTLLDIPAILDPSDRGQQRRERLVSGLTDPALKDFWRAYNALKPERKNENIAPVLRRLRPFETWPSLRGALGQIDSGFDLDDVFASNKVLLVNSPKGKLGEEEVKLFGSLFVAKLWQAAQRRSKLPPEQRTPHFLVVDEVQNFVNLPVSFDTVLAEARKYGLGFVMAHQHMSQLPMELRDAIMPNARSKQIFQTSAQDALTLAREIPDLKSEDLQNLGQFEAIVRLNVDDQVRSPATVTTLKPTPSTGSASQVRDLSRAKYGRAMTDVEADIQARQKVRDEPKKEVFGRLEDS